jgi:hypothetical protein
MRTTPCIPAHVSGQPSGQIRLQMDRQATKPLEHGAWRAKNNGATRAQRFLETRTGDCDVMSVDLMSNLYRTHEVHLTLIAP